MYAHTLCWLQAIEKEKLAGSCLAINHTSNDPLAANRMDRNADLAADRIYNQF